ncbi:MAG: oligosaccharide flippase family protein [Candidatus Omnitrophica bacterium]|nr:oligosaccharide flippase family protein [Candidatus Omnitrophota bacterium]
MKKLSKNTLIYGLGSVLSKSIGILLLPLLTHYLTPNEYGVIGILLMFSVFFSSVISLGFGTSIGFVYFEKKDNQQKKDVIKMSFWALLIVGCAFALISFCFIDKITFLILGDNNYSYLTLLVIFSTVISTISMPLILNIQFLEKAKEFVICNFIISIFSLFINIFFVIILKRGLKGYFESYLFAQALSFFIFSFLNKFDFKFTFDKQVLVKLVKYGLPMVPSFFSLFIIAQSNRYILRYIFNLDSVGIYTVGYNIGSITQIIVNAFQNAWTPYFFSFYHKQEEAIEHFGQILKFFIIIMGFICLCFFIFAKFVVMFFISDQFLSAYKIIGFIALSNLFLGLYSILLPPMYFEKEVKYTSLIQMITAIFTIVVNIPLIFYYKELGASIGFCFGYFFMFLLTWLFNNYKSKSKLKNYKKDPKIIKIVVLFSIFMTLSLVNRNFGVFWEFFFSTFLFFLLIALTYSILDIKDKEKLKNFFIHSGFLRSN